MKIESILKLLFVACVFALNAATSFAQQVWINEIHYDNSGADADEAVEIAGEAGTDLTGWSLLLYNGNNGTVYDSIALSGMLTDQTDGFGFSTVFPSAVQNGAPDGMALVDNNGLVIQFLSYEGTFDATEGAANGMTSEDIGVSQSSAALGFSMQLTGTGSSYADFMWDANLASTYDAVNEGQSFSGSGGSGEVWINEIHYDNSGADADEAVEIAGEAGTDLTGWSLLLYNGNNGTVYDSIALSGTLTDQTDGFGFNTIFPSAVQNGAPDGMALVDNNGLVIQFLSYEGTFDATEGAANGMTSEDIGVSQSSAALGFSMQLTGTGSSYADFTWDANLASTYDAVNEGQSFSGSGGSGEVWINEIHYDNSGADADEAVEIAGEAGTDLTGWSLLLYNGNNGTVYDSIALSGTLTDQTDGFGFNTIFPSAVQNGAPDGMALVDNNGLVIQFLSYEGTFDATEGAANGMTSEDIGVSQSSAALGFSMQLTGTGSSYADFTWDANLASTYDAVNEGQSFSGSGGSGEVWINEIHYDNSGTDADEAVEIAGEAGTDLTGWSLLLYNGNDGSSYDSIALSGTLTDQTDGFGFSTVFPSSIQNGAPDGMALVDNNGLVIQFLSYEGTFDATEGAANGMTSEDIGVSQSSAALGLTLQLIGTGTEYSDFTWSENVASTYDAVNNGQSFGQVVGGDSVFIHEIQGATLVSPLENQTVTVEGIVVGDFQTTVDGFYLQEEDADADSDSMTSEGIFIYAPSAVDVSVGDLVSVTGTVTEFFELTEINNTTSINVVSSGNPLPTSSPIQLPVVDTNYFERYEGMLIHVEQELVVTNGFLHGRGGELWLSGGDRLFQPTQLFRPGASADSLALANELNKLIIDDASTAQNPDPVIFPAPGLSFSNYVRGGASVNGIQGVMTYAWSGFNLSGNSTNAYRVYVTADPVFSNAPNPRTSKPNISEETFKIASFNVLNYFNGDGLGGGFPTARGADNLDEFNRQRDKIIHAIDSMDADIVGLMEIENDGYGAQSAIQDLVNGLNALGGATYAFVDPGVGTIGTDQIAVGLIYNTATAGLTGSAAILNSMVDPLFNDDKNRPALAQSFTDLASGEIITICVNHLKSKGSDCDDLGDPDLGDGQGNCNVTRTEAAQALAAWLGTDPTSSGSPYNMIIGDLNAYAQEDPIIALEDSGYTNLLVNEADGLKEYSYSFDGQWGTLDYAMSNAALEEFVVGTTSWHINADEATALDYNTEFKSAGQIIDFYSTDPHRASDHDPIIVALNFENTPEDINQDGVVDIDDFLLLLGKFGEANCNCPEDINQDGIVNIDDFLQLLAKM